MRSRGGFTLVRPAQATGGGSGGVTLKQYKIVNNTLSDVLGCRVFFNGRLESPLVWVAKPWFLRGADTWDQVKRRDVFYVYDIATLAITGPQMRRGTLDQSDETQIIVPWYETNDIIVAAHTPTDVANPDYANDPTLPQFVSWIDLNVDGRMWARQPT